MKVMVKPISIPKGSALMKRAAHQATHPGAGPCWTMVTANAITHSIRVATHMATTTRSRTGCLIPAMRITAADTDGMGTQGQRDHHQRHDKALHPVAQEVRPRP